MGSPNHSSVPSRLRVLLVDDDPVILETTAALLEDEFDVRTASSGSEALNLLATHPVNVVCADYKMARLNGLELLRQVRMISPRTAGVLVTGVREDLPRGIAGDEAVFAVVCKPYTYRALSRAIIDAGRTAAMTRAVTGFATRSAKLAPRRSNDD